MNCLRIVAVAFLTSILWATISFAQPIGASYSAIEAQIAKADYVVLATISELDRNVIVERGGKNEYGSTDPNGQVEYSVKLKVKEAFKGTIDDFVTDLQPVSTLGFDVRLDQWKEARTSFFCYLGADPKPGEKRTWSYQALGPPVENEELFGDRRFGPMLAQDFSILNTEEEIFARAREYGPISEQEKLAGAPPTVSFKAPAALVSGMPRADYYYVQLPVNQSLNQMARRMIQAPNEFVADSPFDSLAIYQMKMAGVACLRFFKSDINVALLKKLMDEEPDSFESDSNFKPLRVEILETLLGWKIEVPLPRFSKDITVLQLGGRNINDESLLMVGQLENLVTLDLRETKITRDGLMQLVGLKKLTTLSISQSVLTDSKVQALSEQGKLHALSIATTQRDESRPNSPADVASLALLNSPVSDAALKEFSDFTNVVYFDLRSTQVSDLGLNDLSQMKRLEYLHLDGSRITDAGLKHLGQFPNLSKLGLGDLPITDAGLQELMGLSNLTYLRLHGTKVTPGGISKIQKALPKCKIHSSFKIKK